MAPKVFKKKAPAKRSPFKPKSAAPRRMAPKGVRQNPRVPKALGGTIIKQQNLGQQTVNKVLLNAGLPDSRAKILKAVSPMCHFVNTGNGRITTEGFNGRQAWAYTQISDMTDLNNIGTFLSLETVEVTLPRSAPATYLLHKAEHNLKFSNVGQATCRLTIYHCRAKRDIYTTMNYTSPNNDVYAWGDIVESVQQGIEAANGGPLTSGSRYLIPGMDETESPIFNKYFKKMKTTEVYLAVGGAHTLQTHVTYDKVLDASVYSNSNLASALGITDFLLFKAEGQTGVIDEGQVPTIAPCQIAYTQNWDYSFLQVQNARRLQVVSDAITSTSAAVDVISGSTGSGVTATGLVT